MAGEHCGRPATQAQADRVVEPDLVGFKAQTRSLGFTLNAREVQHLTDVCENPSDC